MKMESADINKLIPMEKNIRKHGETQLKELQRSYKQFGQIRPVVVDENNMIIIGHGFWEALKGLGVKTVNVLRLTGLTENKKKKLMVADNKTYELGVTDYDSLNSILMDLKEDNDLSIPGFDDDILASLLADVDEVDVNLGDYGAFDTETVEKAKGADDRVQKEMKEEKPKDIELNSDKIQVEQENENERAKPFVECTHCGEKVWL